MTRETLNPYLQRIAGLMQLKDWDIVLMDDGPNDPDALACVDCMRGRKLAAVYVADRLFRMTAEKQRHTIVHELVHAHFAAMHLLLYKILSGDRWEAYDLAMEYGVDAVANVIAPTMPLPSAPLRRR